MLRPSTLLPLALSAFIALFEYRWPFRDRSWLGVIFGYPIAVVPGLLLWFIYKVYLWPIHLSPLRKYPSPPEQKWWHLGLKGSDPPDYIRWSQEIKHDGIIRIFSLFNTERIILLSEDTIRDAVMKTDTIQRPLTVILELMLGRTNLVTTFGQTHKVLRRRVQPAFNAPSVRAQYPLFWEKAVELAEVVSSESASQTTPINISRWFSRVTLDIVGLGGFATDFNSIQNPEGQFINAYKKTMTPGGKKRLRIFNAIFPEWRWLRYRADPQLLKSNREFRENALTIVTQRQEMIRTGGAEKPKTDILDFAIRDGTATPSELVDYCMTFLFAGHETSSTALTWALYELSHHPKVQDRLREDIRNHLPSPHSKQPFTPDGIDSIPTLASFINEVLRFHCPVPVYDRITTKPTLLGNHLFPENTPVLICPCASNILPRNWPTTPSPPTIFDPYRFLSPTSSTDLKLTSGGASSPYSMMSFSGGPKSCIGERFARAEIAVILAVLIGMFKFELKGVGAPGQMDLAKASRFYAIADIIIGGVWVDMERVEGW